jgi:ribosomal protein L29
MAKKESLKEHSVKDLEQLIAEKREELRRLRFSVAGSKNRNVKEAHTLRKAIARALTELGSRSISLTTNR